MNPNVASLRKHAVETVETLDFLKEIVAAVPDPSAGGTVDLSAGSGAGGEKRRGKEGGVKENKRIGEYLKTNYAPC